ncbi:engulfment and cell motility ELM family protein [Trypanosoma rangeli]|uniref:Engulfment and cell motility ELM family protein n=1 Tax=Trypanosoma rangeli TaxID=5698 RepID=A0A422NQV3_TRYRA|nr:engulfment and cell motility ELM family protein [Trypanosoma rangeli]RNF07821.1 engulfment and cell motility ELM family protein [Trypanosoma rangeli]|eukprot:RNF07821.1 engulfment and cell motility ELM family protein [Trypanosoma rangeli]
MTFSPSFLRDPVFLLTAAVGLTGVVFFAYYWYEGRTFGKRWPFPRRVRRPPVLRGVTASQRPEIATKEAIGLVARGEIATLGGLVYFFRGSGNEKEILLDPTLQAYLQRLLAPGVLAEAVPPGIQNAHVQELLHQLCHCCEQAARLEKERATAFDATNSGHMQLLRELWEAAGKSPADFSHRSEAWVEFGFQGLDPATDFRGGGVLALRQFLHFAQTHNDDFKAMMAFNRRILAAGEETWYLFAVVSIQFTAQLLLQKDHAFYLPQLEVLYDTLKGGAGKDKCEGGAKHHLGSARAEVLELRGGGSDKSQNHSKNDRDAAAHKPWTGVRDFEEGFHTLHHQLLLHFKRCWHRDLPHVMEYNNYMPSVFQSFFVPD